jgi:hypothetical protein
MEDLIQSIFAWLRGRLVSGLNDPRSGYRAMALALRPTFRLSWRGGPMHAALGEIIRRCRRRGLPAIPALVVRTQEGRPGRVYYPIAHPDARTETQRSAAWEAELEEVRRTVYPERL